MTSATGNLVRDTILYDVIRGLDGFPSFERVVAAVPADFDLDTTEYESAIKILNRDPHDAQLTETKFSNVSEGTIAPERAAERMGGLPNRSDRDPLVTERCADHRSDAAEVEGASVEVAMTHEQANQAVLDAENNLGEARLAYRLAQQRTKEARAAMANAITIWQTGLPAFTAEMNVRAHLKAQQAARRERIARGGPATTPAGRSHIDRSAKYSRDNSPEGAARSRMVNGASRGAFSRTEAAARGYKNLDPRRGAAMKLPSDR